MIKKFFKKVLLILLFTNLVFFQISYADDIDNSEEYNFKSESIETSASSKSIDSLSINSRAYVVLDRKTNNILIGKNENQIRKMASTTKIMTAIVIIENCNLSDTIEVSKAAASVGGSRLGLKTGDKITIHDLLYGLMLKSGNDCAVLLAEYAGGSIKGFSELMNQKAADLGLKNTHFETPHGLDNENHYTTAFELALLSNYALNNKTFASIVATKSYTVTINGKNQNISNTNELLGNVNGVYGIKTGFTNGANRCLVSCCKRNDIDIICVVLGADTKSFRTKDSIKLIEYTFQNFKPVNIEDLIIKNFEEWKQSNLDNFFIEKGCSNNVNIKINDLKDKIILTHSDNISKINIDINCSQYLTAPIYKNSSIGQINTKIDDNIIATCDILVENDILHKSTLDYLSEFFINYKNYFYNLL